MELAELFAELLAELKVWVEIRQLKELKVFNALRLFVVVLVEVLVELASETEFV